MARCGRHRAKRLQALRNSFAATTVAAGEEFLDETRVQIAIEVGTAGYRGCS
jgi:hypothetical protein